MALSSLPLALLPLYGIKDQPARSALPGVALVLQGPQGTGKTCFVKPLRDIVGEEHYLEISDREHLVGRFNGHMSAKLAFVVNESSWGGYPKDAGIVKALITEPFQHIERKGITPTTEPNHKRCFFLSNNDRVVGMDADDRRFVALEVSPVLRDEPTFFDRLHHEIASGGSSALLQELLETDLSDFDPRRRPKYTLGRTITLEQKIMGFDVVQRFWYDQLNAGFIGCLQGGNPFALATWPESISVSLLNQLIEKSSEGFSRVNHRTSSATVGRKLKTMCPSIKKKRGTDGTSGLKSMYFHRLLWPGRNSRHLFAVPWIGTLESSRTSACALAT